MASIADGFRNDLEELHKVRNLVLPAVARKLMLSGQEPNLTESRLSLLIDSLASGADVFMARPSGSANRGLESVSGANEMEIVLDGAL
jgi:ribosome assembly protein 3